MLLDDDEWFTDTLASIKTLAKLKPDWDSYGGAPPTEAAIKTTSILAMITALAQILAPHSPAVVPSPDGGMQLEWDVDGAALEIYIDPEGSISGWASGNDEEVEF